MVEVLSEFYGDRPKATVQLISHGENYMYEVLWQGKSVGIYNTEQEAEDIAENYALGSQISRT